jgi:hypothetical protein
MKDFKFLTNNGSTPSVIGGVVYAPYVPVTLTPTNQEREVVTTTRAIEPMTRELRRQINPNFFDTLGHNIRNNLDVFTRAGLRESRNSGTSSYGEWLTERIR